MTTVKNMLSGYSDKQIKHSIANVGGEINYQVNYQGKSSKSFLIPHSTIADDILRQWKQCKICVCVHMEVLYLRKHCVNI